MCVQYVWHINTNDTLRRVTTRSIGSASIQQTERITHGTEMDCAWLFRWLQTHDSYDLNYIFSPAFIIRTHERFCCAAHDGRRAAMNTADCQRLQWPNQTKSALKIHTCGAGETPKWAAIFAILLMHICICGHTRYVRRFPLLSIHSSIQLNKWKICNMHNTLRVAHLRRLASMLAFFSLSFNFISVIFFYFLRFNNWVSRAFYHPYLTQSLGRCDD